MWTWRCYKYCSASIYEVLEQLQAHSKCYSVCSMQILKSPGDLQLTEKRGAMGGPVRREARAVRGPPSPLPPIVGFGTFANGLFLVSLTYEMRIIIESS